MLMNDCERAKNGPIVALHAVADAMLVKLSQYKSLSCCELAELGRILDPRFGNDVISDYDILKKHAVLQTSEVVQAPESDASIQKVGLFEQLLN